MKKLLIAALLCAPAVAFAQPDEPKVESTTHAAAEIEPQPHDPTAHFNFTNFDFRGKDEYGGKYGDGEMTDAKTGHTTREEEPMSAPFVLMLLNFGVLLLILAKWGGPVARKLAQDRHDQIKSALDEAAKLRDQAATKLAEYEAKVKGLDNEVKQIVDGIRADAEADKKRILESATAQAAQMKRDAEQRIAAEIEYARKALQKEVTVAASTATEKLLKDKVTGDDQNKLVSTFITNVQNGRKEAR
ncbi:MAG TPA: ATP synthase F0 subunit B [Kofleriaceae bacterium]|nr:ATP synthase F0 subunit B [Kofleriaceae bacterium]